MENVNSLVKIQEKHILVDNLKINYKQIGNGNIPIILLHGWGINSDRYIEALKQISVQSSEFSVYAPDLPGFGKSDAPPEVWGVDEYANLVKKFSDILNLRKIILIGHSFGGQVAIKFAAKYPERLTALILTGAAGIRHPSSIKQKIFYCLAKIGKIIFSLPLINKLEGSAQKLLYKAAREKDYYESRGIMKEVFKKVIREDLTNYLEKIITPTLLVWGRNDHSTPFKDGEAIYSKILSAGGRIKLEILDEANHSLPYQFPEKFAKITVEFVKNI